MEIKKELINLIPRTIKYSLWLVAVTGVVGFANHVTKAIIKGDYEVNGEFLWLSLLGLAHGAVWVIVPVSLIIYLALLIKTLLAYSNDVNS